MSSPTSSPPAFLHPSLCCLLTCAVPYSLPSCPAITSQRCCLKSSRRQSRDIPRTQSRAQGHLQALCESLTANPQGRADFAPDGRFLPFPSLSLTVHEENCAVQQLGQGAPPLALPLHHKTGVQAQRTVQLHPKSAYQDQQGL